MSARRLSLGQVINHIRKHKEQLQKQTKTAVGTELTGLLILKSSLNIALTILEAERDKRLTVLAEEARLLEKQKSAT